MSEAHTIGKLHSHGREIHILNDDPLDHTSIAEINGALLDPEPVARELIRRWNSHDKLLEACKAVRDVNRDDLMASLYGSGGIMRQVEAAIAETKKG